MPAENSGEAGSESEPTIALGAQPIGKRQYLSPGVVTDKNLLVFGSSILGGLAVLMLLACRTYSFSDKDHSQSGREIFEFAKITLPPIATLILGFYFRGERRARLNPII